ncbi:hypothetical protein [Aeromicrobium sp. Root472D3]|uniref:hypothetical protein n=1 Tax=Aeromicrobium sp. Root472D3 TaxID=1736540 RepID=UPI0006F4C842|nr:hypothetical protein [Aeromicrobium sp. Root472D3]KQX74235.1 hypothetical protein ASD10_03015 [Aeromicrobium sp. Root472D3]
MTSVTRAMVLEAASGLRATEPDATAEAKLDRLVRDIVASAVSVGGDLVDYTAYPTPADASVTGVLIDVSLTRTDSVQTRSLATVALAPTSDGDQLDGSVVVSGLPVDAADGARTLHTSTLSGDVHVSTPVDVSDSGVLEVSLTSVSVEPTPTPTPTPSTPTPSPSTPAPTSTPRTAAELAAARRTYDAALKNARTKYAKARKKAGRSKRKRVAAKKSYDVRRARAKAAYRAAIADVPAGAAPAGATRSAAAVSASAPTTVISTDVGWAPVG